MKVAVIGGGSVYSPELARGFLTRKDLLPLDELALVDIPAGAERMEAVAGLIRRMFQAGGLKARVTTGQDRRAAIDGASFVLNQFRVGGLPARALDEHIPLKYGIPGQETTGPGGFAMGLRTIPIAIEVAREVLHISPTAWILNFSNPAGLVTEAIFRHVPGIRTVGLCNIPLIIKRGVAAAIGVPPERVSLRMIGLNHLSWAQVYLDGQEITAAILASDMGIQSLVANIPGLDPQDPGVNSLVTLARRLGRVPNPYLRYFLLPRAMTEDIQRDVASGKGTRAEQVMALEKRLLPLYREEGRHEAPPELASRGGAWYSEAAVEVMEALHTGRTAHVVVNTVNGGATPDMPPNGVLEVDSVVGGFGVRPTIHGPLPPEMRGLMQQVKAYEELTIEAAVSGDRTAALAALTAHPLVPDVETADHLMEDLLQAHEDYLPAFFGGKPGPS